MRANFFLLAALVALTTVPAYAQVRLRPFGILNGPVVRLSDLFDGTGAAGKRILGPGPAPGQQITVPAAQLATIATEFNVDWHPRSPAERAILERPGRPLRRSEAAAALTPALLAAGAPKRSGIYLSDFSAPDVPPGEKVTIAVRGLDYDRGAQRFSAVLSVSASGMDSIEMPVSGRVEPKARELVAVRPLAPGTIIGAHDLKVAEIPASELTSAVARSPRQAEGLETIHAIAAGSPLRLADLTAPPLVTRGQRVVITLATPDLSLTEQGIALATGAAGAVVHVLNPASHALLAATVTGPGRVSVSAGSLPLRGPDRALRRHYRTYPGYAAR